MTAMRVRKALITGLAGFGLMLAGTPGFGQTAPSGNFPGWQATGAPRTIRPAGQSPVPAPQPPVLPSGGGNPPDPILNPAPGGTIARAPVLDRSGNPPPLPRDAETASRSSEPLRRNQVRSGEIAAIDGASVSLVSGDEALPGDLWGRASAAELTRLLDQVEPHPSSRVLNRLMVRLLQSGGRPPAGAGDEFVEARIKALLRFGRPGDASRLAKVMTGPNRLAVNAALLAGNFESACAKADPDNGAAPFWIELTIWCSARAGDEATALLDIDLMRETGSANPLFIALMDRQLFGAAVDIPPYTELEPLHLAMLAGQGALPDVAGGLPSAYIPLLAGKVQDPVDRAVLKVEAWRLGAATTAQVAQALEAVPNALKGPMAQRFAATRTTPAQPGNLLSFWQYGAEQDRFPLTAALSAEALSDLPLDGGTGDIRYGAVQALTATGNLRQAYEWYEVPPDLAPVDPVAEAHITALLVLVDPQATLEGAGDLEKNLARRAASGDGSADRMLKMIRALESASGGSRPSAVGEAVLRNHISLQGAPLSQTNGARMSTATLALRAAGLEDPARALAIEAAVTPPSFTGG